METTIDQLRYPVGKFSDPTSFSPMEIKQWIDTLEQFPANMKKVVTGLNDQQLDTPYRDGGWTIRQVVHHTADSHLNCYIRVKLALTEDNPTIKPYLEAKWAEIPEAKTAPVEVSLNILDAIHHRMNLMLRNLTVDDLDRTFYHPENKTTRTLKTISASSIFIQPSFPLLQLCNMSKMVT